MANNDRANLRNWDAAQVEQHNRRVRMGRLHKLSANGVTPLSEPAERAIEAARVFTPETPKKPGVKGVIRQSSRQPNKTELRFEQEYLKPWWATGSVADYSYESVTLKIANGCRYTPDWYVLEVVREGELKTKFYEIKARAMIWDDAIVKIKVAAHAYQQFEFYLCAWDGKTGWTIERVRA